MRKDALISLVRRMKERTVIRKPIYMYWVIMLMEIQFMAHATYFVLNMVPILDAETAVLLIMTTLIGLARGVKLMVIVGREPLADIIEMGIITRQTL